MLFGVLFDDPAKVIALAIGLGVVVIGAILNPKSGAAKDYRAGEAAGRAWREKHPVLSVLVATAIIAIVAAIAVNWKLKSSRNAQREHEEKGAAGGWAPAVVTKEPNNTGANGAHPPAHTPPNEGAINANPAVSGMIGQWTRHAGGLTEVWTIRCPAGKWEVSCRYFDGAKDVGSFVGLNVQLSGVVLYCTQHFDRPPPRPWPSGASITIQLDGNKLADIWRFGGSSGSATLERTE